MLILFSLGACSKPKGPRPEPAPVASQSSTKQTLPSATVSAAAVTTPPLASSIDLIHESEVVVRVSEAGVDYMPENLVDGSVETTWHPAMNRPTAEITIELPEGVEAEQATVSLALTTSQAKSLSNCKTRWLEDGADKGAPPFTLGSDGAKEWNVSGTARKLQLEFSGKACANLRLAELGLKGKAPTEKRLPYGIPEVLLGNTQPDFRFEPPSLGPLWKKGRFASLSEACKAQMALTARAAAEAEPDQPSAPVSACKDAGILHPAKPLAEPFRSVHQVEVGETTGNTPLFLFVETTRGWFPANLSLNHGTYDDRAATTYAFRLASLDTRDGRLWLSITRRRADFFGYPGVAPYDVVAELTYVCTLGERLLCHRAVTAFGEKGPSWSRAAWENGSSDPKSPPFHPNPWSWTRSVSVSASGMLRFGRCVDSEGHDTPCRVEAMGHLLKE